MTKLALVLCVAAGAVCAAGPVRILVAYHSDTGNTEKMAQAVRDGAAAVAGTEVIVRNVSAVAPDEITKANGIVLGSPVYWENLTPEAKRFLDRVGEVLGKAGKTWGEGRTAGVFCTGGAVASGKDLTRLSAIAAFLGLRFTVIGGVDEEGYGTLGPQATTGAADPGISDNERAEARRFGERFARITMRFHGAAAK